MLRLPYTFNLPASVPSMTFDPEEPIASLIQNLPGFVYRCRNDPHWTMMYVSDQVESVTGYLPEELEDNNDRAYAELVHPEDRKRIWDEVQNRVNADETFEFNYRIRTREGEDRWVWEQGQKVTDSTADESYLQGFIMDVTERYQQALEHRMFWRIATIIRQYTGFESAVSHVIREICETTGWDYAELWMGEIYNEDSITATVQYNPDNGDLEAFWADFQQMRLRQGEGLVGGVWASGRTEWMKNVSDNRGFLRSDRARAANLNTAFGVPCLAGGTVMGVLVVYLKQSQRRDQRMVDLLTALGGQLGSLLEKKRLRTKLSFRESMYQQILEQLPVDLWMIDLEFHEFLYTNPAFDETWGRYFEDADDIRSAFLDAVHPEDRDRIRENIISPDPAGYDHEFRLHRPTDGQLRWYHDHAFIITDEDGRPRRLVGMGEDITTEKESLLKLEQSQRRFRGITGNIEQVIWMFNGDFTELLYVNPYYETLFQQQTEQLYQDPTLFLDSIHPDDRDEIQTQMNRSTSEPLTGSTNVEYRIIPSEDEIRWVRSHAVPIRDESDETSRIVGFTEDITDRKRIQKELEDSVKHRTTLLQEVHHRVKNNLQMIIALITLQVRQMKSDDPDVVEAFQNLKDRIYSIALVHEQVYEESTIADIDARDYLEDLANHVIQSQSLSTLDVELHTQIEPSQLNVDTLLPCGIVTNELVTNALQHAFSGRRKGQITIKFNALEEDRYELIVADNGVGFPKAISFEQSSSLGFSLVKRLVRQQLNGTIEIPETDDGVKFQMVVQEVDV